MHVASATFAYPHVDGSARAALTRRLHARSKRPAGTFVLDTCLRLEVVVDGDLEALEQAVEELLGDASALDRARVLTGEPAIEHTFRVAAGLESPILGEPEILSQFRQALGSAQQAGSVTGLMVKLLETAVSVGRQARELLPASPHDSMAAIAAQVVGGAERIAVLGSGLMSTAVTEAVRSLPAPPAVTVVARNPERVSAADVEVWPFDRAREALAGFPAVVSATSAKQRLLTDAEMASALRDRTSPLTLVDMAMPPDFCPPSGVSVRYVDIDALARMADRRSRGDEADAMVRVAAADTFRRLSDHQAVGPVIGGLMRSADSVVERTVDRFAGRLGHGDDLEVLRQTAHTVARTLLAAPVSYLQSGERRPEAVDTVAEAFGLEDD